MPCDNLPAPGAPEVCAKGGGGLILPIFGDAEHDWPTPVRGTLYFIGLLWCFCGVAIIADVFMAAIEKVTSKKVLVKDKTTGKSRTISVWNPTVANLTLMALGSSAPEILLNVIGIFPTFISGDLGPGTIVGSAAFNLLCIIAVCVIAIPNGEYRKIKDLGVFAVTAVFSVLAYLWLLIILMAISPDVVEWWEGCLTFVFFWVLLVLAWLADIGKLPGCQKPPAALVAHPTSTPEELMEMQMQIHKKYGQNKALSNSDVSALIAYEFPANANRAQLRVDATRAMFGGRRVIDNTGTRRYDVGAELARELLSQKTDTTVGSGDAPVVQFKIANYTVLESSGAVELVVAAVGELKQAVSVKYATMDGSAKKGEKYEESAGTLEFGPGKMEQKFKVKILKSEGFEEQKSFMVQLLEHEKSGGCQIGDLKEAVVSIIDVDRPGELSFSEEVKEVTPGVEDVTEIIKVRRLHGTSGKVSCKICTENGSALAQADYVAIEKTLEFDVGVSEAEVPVTILRNTKSEGKENFRLIIKEVEGGAIFDATTDGGADSCVMTIFITPQQSKSGFLESLKRSFTVNKDIVELGNANYKEQFIAAVYVGGSKEAMESSSFVDKASHFVVLPWKLLFALVPPVDYLEGWLCFSVALLMIGFVTVLIGDMAELLGCVVGMRPTVTSITLVAVGTSLPDTFASKSAAVMDPYADNSIGNVTGSNSVNVFLGLGLPWMIAGIYWAVAADCEPGDRWSIRYPEQAAKYPGGIFVVEAGSLGTSVAIFSVCAVMCLVTLVLRRQFLGGELGGPKSTAYLTAGFFVSLWILYLVLSIVLGE